MDTGLAIAGCASQRTHGQLANDGDRNIVDAVDLILSGLGAGIGAVGVQDERIYAAREFKKADDRPGNYKATGGHGGILGTVGPPVTIWYKPAYRHTASSDVNLSRLPEVVEFPEYADAGATVSIAVKDDGGLREAAIPRVHIVKYGAYMDEDETANPDNEVDIIARIDKALREQASSDAASPRLHGFVLEGSSPYGLGGMAQHRALEVAAFSGMPVARVGRADPGGRVPSGWDDLTIAGSNLGSVVKIVCSRSSLPGVGRRPGMMPPAWHSGSLSRATA